MANVNQKLSILKEDAWRLTRLDNENLASLVRALLNNLESGSEPQFDNPLLAYVYEDLKRASLSQASETTPTKVPEPDKSNVNGVPNIVCAREDYETVRKELRHNSSLFTKNERKLLRDLFRRNRNRSEDRQTEPILYTSSMANEINVGKNLIYNLRETLASYGVMGWKQEYRTNKQTDEPYKLNYYYINEPELIKLIHDNVELDEPEETVEEPVEEPFVQEEPKVEEVKAELAYSTVTGPAEPKLPALTSTEANMLYWIREASKIRANKEGIGKKGEFVCPIKYLGQHMNGSVIKPTRDKLIEKGYIECYTAPHTTYYVYKIIVFPEYLKNRAS